MPGVSVRLRTMPFSAGTEKMSLRASKSTRFPLGEIAPFLIKPPAFSARGRSVALSVMTSTFTSRVCSVARSSSTRRPPFSNTISFGPMLGLRTSYSAKCVTCRSDFAAVS